MTSDDDVPESLCDCGGGQVHELDCAFLDALFQAKVNVGDVLIIDEFGGST